MLANLGLTRAWARVLVFSLLAGAATFALASGGLLVLTRVSPAGVGYLLGGLAGVAVLLPRIRRALARVLPIDPESPVHAGALVGVALIIGNWLLTELTGDVLASETSGPGIQPIDLVAQELPLLIVALVGVGLFTRRGTWDAVRRLGFEVPLWWQVLLGLAVATAFFAADLGGERLQHLLDPNLASRLEQATNHFYAGLETPLGIVAVALLPGLSEEALFRGALQPRLGLLLTAVAFAAAHPQYAVSVDTALVLVLGFGLGVVRRYTNTTTSFIGHAGYNTLVGLSPLLPDASLPLVWATGGLLGAVLLAAFTRGVLRSRPQA